MSLFLFPLLMCLRLHGVFGFDTDLVSVMDGDSVTLNTGIQTNQQDSVRWHYEGIRIAEISGDLSYICTDVQCNDDYVRFRHRLKLDHQTGSLTIMNIRNTDAGDYVVINNNRLSVKIFSVSVHGVSADTEEVSVMERGSVTLNTGVQTNQQERIRWYYNDIRIAEITGDQRKICTDVQCKDSDERFRDRLKLDHQTGSLTIRKTRTTDSGVYKLKIISDSSISVKIFSVSVHGSSAVDTVEVSVSVMDGGSVTLNTSVQTSEQDRITWYYNGIRIAVIFGDLGFICTDVQCNERFRDRLKLDNQTGSLRIMNTRNTDSGDYTLQITSNKSSISEKIFSVSITAFPFPVPGLTPFRPEIAVVLLVVAVLLIVVAAVAVIYCCECRARRNTNRTKRYNPASGAEDSSPDQRHTFMMNVSD